MQERRRLRRHGQFGARPSGRHANSTPDHRDDLCTPFCPAPRLYVSVAAFCPRTFLVGETRVRRRPPKKNNALFWEGKRDTRTRAAWKPPRKPTFDKPWKWKISGENSTGVSQFGSRRVSFAFSRVWKSDMLGKLWKSTLADSDSVRQICVWF